MIWSYNIYYKHGLGRLLFVDSDDGVIMCRCGYQTDNLLVSSSVSGFQHTAEISPPISTYSRKKKQLHRKHIKSAQETQDSFFMWKLNPTNTTTPT